MIKELDKSKIDIIMKIWLEENIIAHDFIIEDYWKPINPKMQGKLFCFKFKCLC